MNKKPTYTEAFEELQAINRDLENDEICIDELTTKLKRAGELIKICRDQLKTTEDETKKILEQLETEK